MTSLPHNTIIHGDCLAILPTLPAQSVNFVLTDPPYLVSYRELRDGRSVPGDNSDAWLKPAFAELHRVLEPGTYCVSFYGWPHADRFLTAYRAAGFRVVGHMAFRKPYASAAGHLSGQHECAYLLAKGFPAKPAKPISDVLPWSYTGNRLHPTQKPLTALLPLVEAFSAPSGIVLDPFAGSGSSLVAAKDLGRAYLGIELDATYHAVASRRLNGDYETPRRTS